MKYIKLFDTLAALNAFKKTDDFLTPNVSLAEDEPNIMNYEPYIPEPPIDSGSGSGSNSGSSESVLEGNKVLCKYNVTDISSSVILYYQSSGSGSGSGSGNGSGSEEVVPMFNSMVVDGVEQEVTNEYTFDTTGEHTVLFTLLEGVTSINEKTFYYCDNLINIIIGNSVTSIGYGAFESCSGLTSVTIGNSVISIGDSAFYSCSGLTSVTIGNSVTSIGDSAFYGCSGLTSLTIPDSVTSIGNSAFYGCSGLTNITIPDSVTSIGGYAFFSCSGLISIIVGANNQTYDSRNNCNAIIETSTNKLIIGCKNTIIPNSVTSIGNSAFYSCSGLTSITIGNSVTSIGDSAFSGCSGLTSITIGNSVTSIGDSAFKSCSSLTSITIPDSVTSIGSDAFWGCSGLTKVIISDIDSWCNISFGINNANPLSYAHHLYSDENTEITNLIISNSVTSIGNYAFYSCSGLTSVTIGNSVTSIGSGAFYGCSGLTNITIPDSVTSIGDSAFNCCSGLISIIVGANNQTYDSRNNCNAIIETSANKLIIGCKNTIIPNSVTSIGNYAFYSCSGLTNITIPDSVTSIGNYAFSSCSGLINIVSNTTIAPTIKNYTFYNIKINGILTVPTGATGYDAWMGTGNYYLGKYSWTISYQ